jgi:hypothetical protein
MRTLTPVLFLASGCAMGPSPETLIKDIRVLSIEVDPELQPGETAPVESLIVEPDGGAWVAASWTCTRGEDGCVEALVAEQAGVWPGLVVEEGQGIARQTSSLAVASELAGFATDEPVPLVTQYTLACDPGRCGLLDSLLEDGLSEDVLADLDDPLSMLEDLPFAGVSLGLRRVEVSTRDEDDRHQNPTVVGCAPTKGDWSVEAGKPIPVSCDWSSESARTIQAFGYTTAGGWEGQEAQDVFEPGVVDYRWFAPEQAEADIPLWIAFVDGDGGLAVWEGAATAE